MSKKDKFEDQILKDFEEGKFRKTKNLNLEIKKAKQAAANYLTKNARINIRLSSPDLSLIKRKAAEEGMPYQTLIASVLHKFVTGKLTLQN